MFEEKKIVSDKGGIWGHVGRKTPKMLAGPSSLFFTM
jgi:hypothetical protein